MAGTANNISGILLDLDSGTLYIRGSTFVYTMTGTSSVNQRNHNVFDVDGPMSMTGGELVSLIVENTGENADEKSWSYEVGVLITRTEARYFVELAERDRAELHRKAISPEDYEVLA